MNLAALQLGGRLVQDDEAAALQQGAADLDDLALVDGEAPGFEIRVDVESPLEKDCAGLITHPRPVDRAR